MSTFIIFFALTLLILMSLSIALIIAIVWMHERRSSLLPLDLSQYDKIVVFGAHVSPHQPCPELAARLNHALRLHRITKKPIAVSGGFSGSISETEVMAEYLQACGLESQALSHLTPGNSTISTIRSMARHGHHSYWLVVSSPYHSARISYLSMRHGLRTSVSCPSLSNAKFSYLTKQRLRETLAILKQIYLDTLSILAHSIARAFHLTSVA
jgi:uncharacterized SAM-binding protein YcdF (DUF218 family)